MGGLLEVLTVAPPIGYSLEHFGVLAFAAMAATCFVLAYRRGGIASKVVAIILLPLAILMVTDLTSVARTPRDVFRLHFSADVPSSVEEISASGFTGLNASDVILTFKIKEAELDPLLSRRGFMEVTGQIEGGTRTGIPPEFWIHNVKLARDRGISPCRCFEITKYSGMVYYLVMFDLATNRALYHYVKL